MTDLRDDGKGLGFRTATGMQVHRERMPMGTPVMVTQEDIDLLRAIPVAWAHPSKGVAKLDRGRGVVLDYMGHADVTMALIEVDPAFTYRYRTDDRGRMDMYESGKNYVLEGELTVLGVTRPCVGTCEQRKGEPEKELIGDLLRNGAMRFGIATGLWSKVDDVSDQNFRPAPDEPMDDNEVTKFRAACADAGLDPLNVLLAAGVVDADRPMRSEKPKLLAQFVKMRDAHAEHSANLASDEAFLATRDQVGAIKGEYKRLKITARENQLHQTADIVGHKVPSHNNLTTEEASAVIDALKAMDPPEPEHEPDERGVDPVYGDEDPYGDVPPEPHEASGADGS